MRKQVLERDRARVDVRERLVGLVHGDREHRERCGEARGDDSRGQLGRIGDSARQDEEDAEHEHPRAGDEVAETGSPERPSPIARKPCVVRDQRHPRDGDRDHEVHPEPDRHPTVRLRLPQPREIGLRDRPPGQIRERRQHRVHGVAPDEATDDADRPQQRERRGDRPEDERPEPPGAEAEELVGERRGRGGDDDQLERRPTPALKSVQHRGRVRAGAPERRAHQHHSGHACVGADQSGRSEHRVADEPAEQNCEQRVAQRERGHEQGADDDHEQRHAERTPEQPVVEQAEHPQPLGNRLDSPRRLLTHFGPPFAGITRIRFCGCDLSLSRGTPERSL